MFAKGGGHAGAASNPITKAREINGRTTRYHEHAFAFAAFAATVDTVGWHRRAADPQAEPNTESKGLGLDGARPVGPTRPDRKWHLEQRLDGLVWCEPQKQQG